MLLHMLRLLTCCALLLLGGCEQNKTFNNPDITGAPYAQKLELTDHTGKKRNLSDFKGRAVLVFFGYTQCPDVCPTTMTEMAAIMKKLGPRADELQVIFVTLDPERDNQALLAQYVPAFDKRFLGMYGSLKETEEIAREFKIIYQKVASKSGNGNYTIDHTAGSYLFDKQGRVRLFVRYGQPLDSLLHDVEMILS